MKKTGKHRAPAAAQRPGVAALMVGGLLAGTVATAGATSLSKEDKAKALTAERAHQLEGSVAAALDAREGDTAASGTAAALASLRSDTLVEMREAVAADRSTARKAPKADGKITTTLAAEQATFSGFTPVVEEPEAEATETEIDQVEAEATETETDQVPAEAPVRTEEATPAQQAATERQETTASRTETRSEPATTTQSSTTQASTQQAAPAPAAPATVASASVVANAMAYVGYPYVLNGTPPYNFDCSGLTWWAFQQAGIDIPRSVAGQKGVVTPVSNPQPGDLVFYNNFYHVGLYAGNGMIVEAMNPSEGVVYHAIWDTNIWYGRVTG